VGRLPLALAHDYLTQRGGAERVVATWCRSFPDAPLYTALYDPARTFDAFRTHEIHTSWLNRVSFVRHDHRRALPLLAPTTSLQRIDADVVLASSSGWAHAVRTDGRLVVYCHAPARWLYQKDRYLAAGALGAAATAAAHLLGSPLRAWDQRAAQRADQYLANSTFTQRLIQSVYGIDAPVIAPPVALPNTLPADSDRSDVLIVARLLPYKNVDLAIEVARELGDLRFRVVGDGPLRASLERSAPPNVTFAGAVDELDLWREYTGTRVHLALSHEDFGITPLEAAAAGRPTIARRSGGYIDTITESTGILLDEAAINARNVAQAVREALESNWGRIDLQTHAAHFSPARHIERIQSFLGA